MHWCVSIHARVKRATQSGWLTLPTFRVSIHARVKRATGSIRDHVVHVSIHARVKRATRPCLASPSFCQQVSIHARVKRATPRL